MDQSIENWPSSRTTNNVKNEMAKLRIVDISGFRGIKKLTWLPQPGVNALIGPGDSCKSTILEAIDWCLGTRRTLPVTYADFFRMDSKSPLRIVATVGDLPTQLLSITKFGECFRGFKAGCPTLEEEPKTGYETVIQIVLKVEEDLEPEWFIPKEDGNDDDVIKLPWEARKAIAPLRIGTSASHHLTWRRGSALSNATEGNVSAGSSLSAALYDARDAFANAPHSELQAAIELAMDGCKKFAVADIEKISAGLDIDAVFAGETCIALHDQDGIPLRRMGVGSVRLLSSALVSSAKEDAITLVDELEYGLEPHRVIRLLHSLGTKEETPVRQVFVTTHSPIAVAELTTAQIWMVRGAGGIFTLTQPDVELQGTVRTYPNALLSRKVLVCEGASEVGIMRGLDRFANEGNSQLLPGGLLLHGVALVDGRGSSAPANALALRRLGFPVALLRDSDVVKKKPKDKAKWDKSAAAEESFVALQGKVFCWEDGYHTEAAVFKYATVGEMQKMIEYAKEFWGEELVSSDMLKHCAGASLAEIELSLSTGDVSDTDRLNLGISANKGGWFKRIDHFETVTNDILLPSVNNTDVDHKYLRRFFRDIVTWCKAAG